MVAMSLELATAKAFIDTHCSKKRSTSKCLHHHDNDSSDDDTVRVLERGEIGNVETAASSNPKKSDDALKCLSRSLESNMTKDTEELTLDCSTKSIRSEGSRCEDSASSKSRWLSLDFRQVFRKQKITGTV